MPSLNADSWQIDIDSNNGSLFQRCHYLNQEVFRDFKTAQPPQSGAGHFPLLPYSNRIKDGRFKFQNQSVILPDTLSGHKHALHGYGWMNAWQLDVQTPNECVLIQQNRDTDWPWDYEARQLIAVRGSTLCLKLELTNQSETPMPCGLGFHPYFPDLEQAMIAFDSDGVWLADDQVLPTAHVMSPPGFDFSTPQRLKRYRLDHCFTGTNRAEISWLNSDKTIQIKSSENLSRAAVYTAHEDDCFCFEPISHTHNALNMVDPVAEGIKILAPEETMMVWSEFTVSFD